MMSGVTHHIRQCTVDVWVESEEKALSLRPRLSSLVKGRVMQIIDEVFAETEGTVRIDRLEIDLGSVELSGFEEDVETKLRRALREALLGLATGGGKEGWGGSGRYGGSGSGRYGGSGSYGGRGSYGYYCLEPARSGLEKLGYFLLYGCLPWWADRNGSFEELFAQMMDLFPRQLLELIKELSRHEYVISRIVGQARGELLARLIQKMELPFDRWIIDYITDIGVTHQRAPLVRAGSRDFEKTVWKLVLSYLLMDRGSQFNKKTFVKWNIGQIARQYGMKYESLLFFLSGCVRKVAVNYSFQSSLMGIIRELATEHIKSDPAFVIEGAGGEGGGKENDAKEGEGPALVSFENFLVHGELVPETDSDSPSAVFNLLLEKSRGRIRRLIEELGYSESVQERIREELPLSAVVQLVEPDEHEFIATYAAELRRSHRSRPAVKASSEEFEKVAWKFILNYLMNDRGSDFNRKSFVKWNLTRIAAEYNTSYASLLNFMLQSLRSMSVPLTGESSLPALFGDLAQDIDKEQSREMVLSSFFRGGQADEGEMRELLREYMREYPADCRAFLVSMADVDGDLPVRLSRICAEDGGDIIRFLQPGGASFLKEYEKWIRQAADMGLVAGGKKGKEEYRVILLRRLLNSKGKIFNAAVFLEETLQELLDVSGRGALSKGLGRAMGRMAGYSAPLQSMVRKAIGRVTAGLPSGLRKKLSRAGGASKGVGAAPGHSGMKPKFGLGGPGSDKEPLYIRNAGLILLHPYFARYFELLQLLKTDEGGKKQFRDEQAIFKGIHALQYLVNERTDTPEHELLLNKLLCGYPLQEAVPRSVELTDAEKGIAGGLLKGAIQNWPMIRQSSVEALRTFLVREGKLLCREQRWDLEVENKTVDILIDHLPWSINIIKQDWMEQTLYVKWRK